tara:strand:- start:242 stop:586 length:345 start_codon:yes stop_codon:yes gene_type:complete
MKIKRINSNRDKVRFLGKFSSLVNNSNNTVLTSLSLLRKYRYINRKNFYSINIKKNIPVFSGLGGGSSNSAAIIKYFLKGRKLKKKRIKNLYKQIRNRFNVIFKFKSSLSKQSF